MRCDIGYMGIKTWTRLGLAVHSGGTRWKQQQRPGSGARPEKEKAESEAEGTVRVQDLRCRQFAASCIAVYISPILPSQPSLLRTTYNDHSLRPPNRVPHLSKAFVYRRFSRYRGYCQGLRFPGSQTLTDSHP